MDEVTQSDREVAADIWAGYVAKGGEFMAEKIMREGAMDSSLPTVVACHRIASTTALQAENERLRGVVEKVTENCRYHRNRHLTATQLIEMLLTIVEPALGDNHG